MRDTTPGWVVTHGEPHPGNVIRTSHGLRIIDWTTVQMAPPERDLWMLTSAFTDMIGADPVGVEDDVRNCRGLTGDPRVVLWLPEAGGSSISSVLSMPVRASGLPGRQQYVDAAAGPTPRTVRRNRVGVTQVYRWGEDTGETSRDS